MQMTKGERLVAEMLGDTPQTGMPVLTEEHPFLRKVVTFMQTRKEWLGTATDLLNAVGDTTPHQIPSQNCCGNMIINIYTRKKELMCLSAVPTVKGS